MQRMASVRVLGAMTAMMVGLLALFAIWDMVLLLTALFAPDRWSAANTLTTAIPGFELPTVHLHDRLIFIDRQVATIGLAALFILPIAGIARSLGKDGAFTASNVVRLRLLALGCGIYGVGPLLIPLLPIDARIPLGLLGAHVNWPAAAMTFVALSLAQIFRDGMALREDVEATI